MENIKLSDRIPENEQVEIQPCGCCFTEFIFDEH